MMIINRLAICSVKRQVLIVFCVLCCLWGVGLLFSAKGIYQVFLIDPVRLTELTHRIVNQNQALARQQQMLKQQSAPLSVNHSGDFRTEDLLADLTRHQLVLVSYHRSLVSGGRNDDVVFRSSFPLFLNWLSVFSSKWVNLWVNKMMINSDKNGLLTVKVICQEG